MDKYIKEDEVIKRLKNSKTLMNMRCLNGQYAQLKEMRLNPSKKFPQPMCGLWCCAGIASTRDGYKSRNTGKALITAA